MIEYSLIRFVKFSVKNKIQSWGRSVTHTDYYYEFVCATCGGIFMKYILDRIEGDYAVCFDDETGKTKVTVLYSDLGKISEGDIFTADIKNDNKAYNVKILKEETAQRKASLQKKLNTLFNNKK